MNIENLTILDLGQQNESGYWPADGKHYKALNDGTVWTPEEHPAAWEVADE